ncbi:protein ApaG [Litchfieldella qijiaojingensis]|uniref:Protein ApaG n=1 Tax=Litchfieldella qijiaojingensis TaxID=980347 RepID=A0ABQ2Z0R4_9GAMM|nr:Co2+/Mg2+ efflux protein ApaG [Halomonas qijiaojingensis]GGY00140.1 protein ApaG [Halomonas qijiaojingensis]
MKDSANDLSATIRVHVEPTYREAESSPAEQRYVFSYAITVHNHSLHSVQLLARYWKITQGSGKVQEVRGKGVVGKQPLIGPGQTFRYTSRAVLECPVGVMEGAYTCVEAHSQQAFEVRISPFRLAGPNQVH